MEESLQQRLAKEFGPIANVFPVEGRGFTATEKAVISLRDDSRVFVKSATDEATAESLRTENRNYDLIKAGFMPKKLGWIDDVVTVLVLEDLSEADWRLEWTFAQLLEVEKLADELHKIPPPAELPLLTSHQEHFQGWQRIMDNSKPFLKLGLVDEAWLKNALPKLVAGEKEMVLEGNELLHYDLRTDNLCRRDGKLYLVDWADACVGNGAFDTLFLYPSVYVSGGPAPWDITLGPASFIAAAAGYYSDRATQPPPSPGSTLRDFQRRHAEIALEWAVQALGLPRPGTQSTT